MNTQALVNYSNTSLVATILGTLVITIGENTGPRAESLYATEISPFAALLSQDPQDAIRSWPEVSRQAAQEMIAKYGQPDSHTVDMLIWNDNGPWHKTIVYRQPVEHNFPKKHQDCLEQFVMYRVPVNMFDDLAKYDGSVVCQRTNGLLSARCDKEPMNFLALNLAHRIAQGEITVEEARKQYATTAKQFMDGQRPDITQKLIFSPQGSGAADPDEPML